MSRSLILVLAASLVSVAVGCGDASAPAFRKETAAGPMAGSSGSSSDPSGDTQQPAAPDPSSGAPSAPPAAPPTGNVYFRVANFFSGAADACVSSDGGATWTGPLMKGLSGKPLAPSTV